MTYFTLGGPLFLAQWSLAGNVIMVVFAILLVKGGVGNCLRQTLSLCAEELIFYGTLNLWLCSMTSESECRIRQNKKIIQN